MLHIIYGFSQKIRMDQFSSKTACDDPENENFRKISGWVFHNLPIRVKSIFYSEELWKGDSSSSEDAEDESEDIDDDLTPPLLD